MPVAIALVTILIGLGLAFLGRKVIKILVFLGAGFYGAQLAFSLLEGRFSQPVPFIGALIAFVALGFLSIMILKFIFGIMLGIAGYLIIMALTSNQIMAILAGIIIFIIGLFLFKYYLSIATAFGGAMIVFSGLAGLGLGEMIPLIVAVIVGITGAYAQFKQIHK